MSDNKPWVKDSGHATESELAARVQKYPIDGCWAAFYTDRFAAGRTADGVPLSTPENLLELRVFGEAGELWLCRSRVGQPFRWRLAVDAGDKDQGTNRSNLKKIAAALEESRGAAKMELARVQYRDPDFADALCAFSPNEDYQLKALYDITEIYDLWIAGRGK